MPFKWIANIERSVSALIWPLDPSSGPFARSHCQRPEIRFLDHCLHRSRPHRNCIRPQPKPRALERCRNGSLGRALCEFGASKHTKSMIVFDICDLHANETAQRSSELFGQFSSLTSSRSVPRKLNEFCGACHSNVGQMKMAYELFSSLSAPRTGRGKRRQESLSQGPLVSSRANSSANLGVETRASSRRRRAKEVSRSPPQVQARDQRKFPCRGVIERVPFRAEHPKWR